MHLCKLTLSLETSPKMFLCIIDIHIMVTEIIMLRIRIFSR